ncbi:MAG: hypothetical protein WBA66_05950 [Xanthobacteraceae bacterium]
MDQSSLDRLREFLAQLAPGTKALLMRECERALAQGGDAVADLVLGELRRSVRGTGNERSRGVDSRRQVFLPLEPFLVDAGAAVSPGRIRRPALEAVWQWLSQEVLVAPTRDLEAALGEADGGGAPMAAVAAVRAYRVAAGEAIAAVVASTAGRDGERLPARLAVPKVAEDLAPIGAVLAANEALEGFAGRLPGVMTAFGPAQIGAVLASLDAPLLKTPLVLPFALAAVAGRLASPWQIVRLAIHIAGSDDEARVAAVPYGVAVTIALDELARLCVVLRADIRRGRFDHVADHLKAVHDGVRGLRTELDLRGDSAWGRQLAAIRKDVSGALQAEIANVPGRARRLLRPRTDRDIGPTTRLDPTEVDETAAMIGLVAVCRSYAGELALSEVTQRAFTELQYDVERATTALVGQLKGAEGRARAFRQHQVEVALRFCTPLFGADFTSLMARAAENAGPEPRPAARAG